MAFTTIPSIVVTLIVFIIISITMDTSGATDVSVLQTSLAKSVNISPFLFIVPAVDVALVLTKIKPIISLSIGVLLAAVFALIFQPEALAGLAGGTSLDFMSALKGVLSAIFVDSSIASDNAAVAELLGASGMWGMKKTVLLVIAAMIFGGAMEAIGALSRISSALLSLSDSIFGLFASTVASCLALNVTASDQYLAIVIPGKMFSKAYEEKGLAPENLSRTLEDSGTVTSALIPYNTCGAYQSTVLGVSVAEYFINIEPLSPDLKMTACILLIGIGILTIALSVPMFLRKVKRNGIYGFRTPLTLSSDEVWYPSNRYAAITMMIWSAVAIGLGGVSLFFRPLSSVYEMFLLFFPVTILLPCLIAVRWAKERFGKGQ